MKKRVLVPPSQPRRGAPLGNRNALKHGRYTRARLAVAAETRAYIRTTRKLARDLTRLALAAKQLATVEAASSKMRRDHSLPPLEMFSICSYIHPVTSDRVGR